MRGTSTYNVIRNTGRYVPYWHWSRLVGSEQAIEQTVLWCKKGTGSLNKENFEEVMQGELVYYSFSLKKRIKGVTYTEMMGFPQVCRHRCWYSLSILVLLGQTEFI